MIDDTQFAFAEAVRFHVRNASECQKSITTTSHVRDQLLPGIEVLRKVIEHSRTHPKELIFYLNAEIDLVVAEKPVDLETMLCHQICRERIYIALTLVVAGAG